MKQHSVVFLPSDIKVMVDDGSTILSAARMGDEAIETICGGKASCGKCKVRILEGKNNKHNIVSTMGHLLPLTDEEQNYSKRHRIEHDQRLACQAKIKGDVVVMVPEESRIRRLVVQKETGEKTINLDPAIRKYHITIAPPDLENSRTDWDILQKSIEDKYSLCDLSIDREALESLPKILQESNGEVTIALWDDREVICIEPGISKNVFGLAVDVGTTSVAIYLCDLVTGKVIATEAMMNPQVKFGEDVITRIAYADSKSEGLNELNSEIISGLNQLIKKITSQNKLKPKDISEVVLVGNTAMHHILLKLDVASLGKAPFAPSIKHSVDQKARTIGLKVLPSANVHVLPIEAGFVGADNVSVLIAEEPHKQDEMLLIIDIGTNGELVLGNRNRLLSASCATGPALEGACIKFGMRAAKDTIDRVRVDPETFDVSFSVIGEQGFNTKASSTDLKARGICGSGIIDAVSEMFTSGIIRKNGSINKELKSKRLIIGNDGKAEFVIAWSKQTAIGQDITVTQEDVRAIQLAKAAIYAGSMLLLNRMGIKLPDKVLLAGAFGSVIDKKRALAIGMFPDCGLTNVSGIGNAAGDGARFALLNRKKRKEADKIARQVEYIELTQEPSFQDIFIKATHFPGKDG